MFTIRDANVGDAAEVAETHCEAWHAAYQGLLALSVVARRNFAERKAFWTAVLQKGETWPVCRIAELSGLSVAFASSGPARPEILTCFGEAAGGVAEVYAIYVRPAFQRQGIGSKLLRDAFRLASARGLAHMGLWVLTANQGAVCFYEKQMGVLVGHGKVTYGDVDFERLAFGWEIFEAQSIGR